MTDFSDCINYIDRIKIEIHERIKFVLEVNAQLEERISRIEERHKAYNQDINKYNCEVDEFNSVIESNSCNTSNTI